MLLAVHETLVGVGKFIGALALISGVFALYAVPVGALILAGVYASLWSAEVTGGGMLVGFPVLFGVWSLGAVCVGPFVQPKLAAMVGACTWD